MKNVIEIRRNTQAKTPKMRMLEANRILCYKMTQETNRILCYNLLTNRKEN